jgi:hypothetical protein
MVGGIRNYGNRGRVVKFIEKFIGGLVAGKGPVVWGAVLPHGDRSARAGWGSPHDWAHARLGVTAA